MTEVVDSGQDMDLKKKKNRRKWLSPFVILIQDVNRAEDRKLLNSFVAMAQIGIVKFMSHALKDMNANESK